MQKTALVCLLLILPTMAALADHHDESAPDSMLRQLDFLAGTWRCSGTAFAMADMPQHATTAEVTGKWDESGYWLALTYAEKKTAENAHPFRFTGYFGYDPEIKKLVGGGVDSMGGYSTGASDGMSGDTLAFTGPWHMHGMTANSRDTFRKLANGRVSHTGEIEQNGKWVKIGEETCTKQ